MSVSVRVGQSRVNGHFKDCVPVSLALEADKLPSDYDVTDEN